MTDRQKRKAGKIMAEFEKVMKDKERMCEALADIPVCGECSLRKKVNKMNITCTEFIEKYPSEAEQIIEDWADKNPVMTNGMMFEKTFGYAPGFCCVKSKNIECPDDISCSDCPYSLDAEYHAPEGSEKE